MHAGEGQTRRERHRLPDGGLGDAAVTGSCSVDAECIQKRGEETRGDGLIALACSGQSCTCLFSSLVPRAAPTSFHFTTSAPCTTAEAARRVLQERCLFEK